VFRVTAVFKTHKISKLFDNVFDAIEFKEDAEAYYPIKVTFEKGIAPMRTFIVNSWNSVMNSDVSPLKNIPDLQVRHMIMQVLAWMWCITFAMIVGSWTVFSISAIAHVMLIAAIVITVGTFETAKRKPTVFTAFQSRNGRGNGGEHE
jgi:hypothetical protein